MTLFDFTNKNKENMNLSEANPQLPADHMTPSSLESCQTPNSTSEGCVNDVKQTSNNDLDKTDTTLVDESL